MNPEEQDDAPRMQLLGDARALLKTQEGQRFFRWFFATFPYAMEINTGNANIYYYAGRVSVSRLVAELLAAARPDLMTPLLLREDFNCGQLAER
jgi:hypothetical protein